MQKLVARVLLVAVATLSSIIIGCSANGDDDSTNLIVGGFKVNVEDFPYQIALFRDDRFVCGGTIIGPFWVVTAQHCAPDTKAHRYKVVVGADIPDNGQRLEVAEVFLPPDNEDRSTFDVSLLKLEHELHYSGRVGCLPLMASNDQPAPGTPAVITGYGMTIQRSLDTTLRAATVGVLPHDKCIEFYNENVKPYMFCAGFEGGQVDSCQGDSGGPLVVDRELAGVTDWGLGCARSSAPGVYIAVSSFKDWLQDVVRKQRTSDERKLCAPKEQEQ